MALSQGGTAPGKLVVISAPSGSGKTTIAREIIRLNPSLRFSISATTRQRREREADGKDYYFLNRDEFQRRVSAGDFVEWEELFGNFYGTLKSELNEALKQGKHILFDVDVKGGLSIKREYQDTLMIFIRTPSVEVLRERLIRRQTESDAMLAKRVERVPMELELGKTYPHQIVNDNLQRAVQEVQAIVANFLLHESTSSE